MDDDAGFHVLLQRLHKRQAMEKDLVCLESGEACLEYFQRVVSGESEMPAVVMVDINMPGMNGFDTVSQIRAMEGCRKLPPIYILSSSNNRADVARATEVGADCYIEKPFRISELPIFQ